MLPANHPNILMHNDGKSSAYCVKPHAAIFLLWLINRQKIHGYGIIKALHDSGIKIGPSRLYPFLNAMLEEGLIAQKEMRTGRRVRKIYVITSKGRKMLEKNRLIFKGIVREFVIYMLGLKNARK
jgi:DNA-binding PadR family transcriptional regulator